MENINSTLPESNTPGKKKINTNLKIGCFIASIIVVLLIIIVIAFKSTPAPITNGTLPEKSELRAHDKKALANATIKDISNIANEAISGVTYTVLSEKKDIRLKSNTNKCILLIEIKEKISVEKLKLLANELRSTRKSYTKLWIFYYLPGMKTNAGAWATTNFDPELIVKIF